MDKLYENIRKRRIEIGMTQAELANKVGYKDHTTINKIEKGLVDISVGKLKEIAKALKTSPITLLYGEDE